MLYFIVNPASSSGKGMSVWKKCARTLRRQQVPYRAFLLKDPQDVVKAAGAVKAAAPCTAVIVGGDGTINHFLCALPDFDGITFACIPSGSGNDFARGMNLSKDPQILLQHIISGKRVRMINIGLTSCGDQARSFAVSSGTGFDAAVCHASESSSPVKQLLNRFHLGKLIYLYNALGMLFSMKLFRMRVITDNKTIRTFDKVCFAAVMNTRYEGGGFMFAPQADPGDDQLDLIIAEGLPKWKILLLLPTAFFGKHTRYRGIHLLRCSSAVLSCEEAQCVHTDGEHLGYCRKVQYALRPQKLRMIV